MQQEGGGGGGGEDSSLTAAAVGSEGTRAQEGDKDDERWLELTPRPPTTRLPAAARVWPVAFGFPSTQGRLDTVSLRPGLHTWINGWFAHALLRSLSTATAGPMYRSSAVTECTSSWMPHHLSVPGIWELAPI
ncbi:unnamed protein product [Urochloa humidicola]